MRGANDYVSRASSDAQCGGRWVWRSCLFWSGLVGAVQSQIGGVPHRVPDGGHFGASNQADAMSLHGQFAWVIGGAGIIGKGICRGLLRAGATVIINSRHNHRLSALSEELGHPANLIALSGSMLPGGSEATVRQALGVTGERLDHVISHSGVRWWDKQAADETSTLTSSSKRVLHLSAEEFAQSAVQLPLLHFEAARLLMPYLSVSDAAAKRPRSYTFVNGGTKGLKSPIAHINQQAMWGLSSALQLEAATEDLTFSEV